MTDPSVTNALAILSQGNRYEDTLWDHLFEIWLFLADRNCAKARDLLLGELRQEGFVDDSRVPTLRAIQKKVKSGNWAQRGNDLIRSTAEHIHESQIARLFVLSEKALHVADDILDGKYLDHPRPGNLAVMADMAKEMLKFQGLGTAGVVGAPTLEVKIEQAAVDLSKYTPEELAEMSRQAVLQKKELRRLTGKKN